MISSSTMNYSRSLSILISLFFSTVTRQIGAANPEVVSAAAINPTGEDGVSSMSLAERLSVKFTTAYQSTPHTVILSSYFPTEQLHNEFEGWMEKFKRAYDSAEEMAWRKLVWLENHCAYNGDIVLFSLLMVLFFVFQSKGYFYVFSHSTYWFAYKNSHGNNLH